MPPEEPLNRNQGISLYDKHISTLLTEIYTMLNKVFTSLNTVICNGINNFS